MESTGYHHIEIRDGTPCIRGTRVKVYLIAEDLAAGLDGQAIFETYDGLTLPQIYSALGYYFEHKEEIDADIERREQLDEVLRAELEDPDFVARAREMKQARQRQHV
jgi:uncharacterized protein (DUF433 family)